MAYLTLALFLAFVAGVWSAVLIFFMARHLLRPRRMTDGRALARLGRMTPADLNLPFTPMGFTVRDRRTNGPIRLAAWWMAAASPSPRTAVVVHGYGDAKVGGIAWAPTWHALGWNVLAVDLRAHGDSEGRDCTAGFFERDDLNAVVDALRIEKPAATARIALFGVSLGSACVAATAATRDDLAAVVLESPYADYRNAVRTHVRRAGFPLVSMTNLVCRVAEWLSGSEFRSVRPRVTIPKIAAPLLIIYGDADPLIEPAALAEACAERPPTVVTRLRVWPGVPHVVALAKDPDAYAADLGDFLRVSGAAGG